MSVDGTPTTNYLDSNFTVKAGAKVSVSLDRSNYSIDNILLNGKTYTSYGNIDFFVTDTTTLSIKAHKYSTVKATITIDHPDKRQRDNKGTPGNESSLKPHKHKKGD